MLPQTIVILGADRVGKSTIVENTKNDLISRDICVRSLHFSGPQPHHHTPIQQYIDPFQSALDQEAQVVICDRGFSEVCFYEKFRRHIEISEEWANSAESFFSAYSQSIKVFLVERTWEWSLPFHIIEINTLYPGCSDYYLEMQLKARHKEHVEYYAYMRDYLANRSLLSDIQIIAPTSRHFSLADVV
jgi:hypothetical protein